MPNLDNETKNFYKMQYAAIAICHSIEKYQQILTEIFEPTNRMYAPTYYTIGINITMPYDEFISAIDEAKKKCGSAYNNRLDKIKELWTVYYTGEASKDINILAPRNIKNKSKDAASLFIQIFYYFHRNEMVKANKLKDEFMDKYSNLLTNVDLINKAFNHIEE